MTRAPGVIPLLAGVLLLFLTPADLHAWGPGTHVAIGEALLSSLHLLPAGLASLLGRFPVHFLYGSVAADISFAKKYVPEGRHSHHWHIGEEILAGADSEPLRAVGYGYLAHLAADTLAHNLYVPRQLVLAGSGASIGHTYWEHRMDLHLGEAFLGRARRLVLEHDHREADLLFTSVLSRTIFSFETNRRLFRGMIRMQDDPRWKLFFDQMVRSSRFDIPQRTVDAWAETVFDHVVEYLVSGATSRAGRLDPIGEEKLRMARQVRREATGGGKRRGVERLGEAADRYFPLPEGPILYRPSAPIRPDSRPGGLLAPPGGTGQAPASRG